MFRPVDTKTHVPEIEHKYLDYWRRKDIFKKSLENRAGNEKFVFFDGPPFANGLPHYGHILAQSLKDAITRYKTMRGYYVPRTNGWDCHGLPVEYEIEKKLNLSGRHDIEEMGVESFNAQCRESVFTYTEQWEDLFERLARWVDLDQSYATLDKNYMESIWWVFKQIWDKDMVYQGHRSMHVCPRCVTPLSNFEVSQGYKMVTDLSVTAKFRSKDNPNLFFLAWTTTPWTLPGNTALAVNPELEYCEVEMDGQSYILAYELLEPHFELDGLEVKRKMKGSELVGMAYEPLFPYYAELDHENIEKAFHVLSAEFVTTDSGTGIVHIAGGYGEDDLNLIKENDLPIIQHVDMSGHFKQEVVDFETKFNKGQDHNIADWLSVRGLLFKKENYKHSYPHCWRCDAPLMNFATRAWFIRVSEIRDRLVENNKKINWQPSHIKEGRFGKWLENARDWNVSRNRFWGCPIPIWRCEACTSIECIGSMEELKARSGKLPMRDGEVDLHKPYIDEIKLPCKECSAQMNRIPEVLDCWFESGSMPYAQLHYPFENKELFEKNFPADFIAEGLDQTRGWFYTLHVISTILFDQPAFQNVIVNGILLAADGEKLSKRKKNYPDPSILFEEKGVDSLRFFLYNSTTPIGEDARFSDKHVEDLFKKFTLTLWNTYAFFVTYANIDGFDPNQAEVTTQNQLDQWILSRLQALILEVTKNMDDYNLNKATRPIVSFVDELSNWYVRRSRRRFWKSDDDSDKQSAYKTLHTVLTTLSKLLAPFMPFLSEEIYRNLTGEDSVHLADWPVVDEKLLNESLNEEMTVVRNIVNLGHSLRAQENIKVRQPLSTLRLALPSHVSHELVRAQENVILEELNIKNLEILEDADEIASQILIPKARVLGPRLGGQVQEVIKLAKAGEFEVLEGGSYKVGDHILSAEEADLAFKGKDGEAVLSENGLVLTFDFVLSDALVREGVMREIVRQIQDMRKEADFAVDDRIELQIKGSAELELVLTTFSDVIKEETLAIDLQVSGDMDWELKKDYTFEDSPYSIAIKRQ